jgi:general secretion pathway protein B
MSYILDALKKAERERSMGDVPDLESAHWGVRRQERSWRWMWIVAALLLFNVVLLGYMLSRDEANVQQLADSAPAIPPAEVPAQVPVSPPPAQVQVSPPPAQLPVSSPLVQAPVKETPITVRPKVAVQPHVASKPVAEAAPAPTPRVVQAQQPLTEPASEAESELPEWGELSLEFRSRFVLPRIDVHVFDEEPRRRFILANMRKYREGDTLESGAVLEEILPTSIQLNYQGTRFRVDR